MTGLEAIEDVSCETREKLRAFEDLILKWTARINLIAKSTRPVVRERHIIDSVQFWPLAPDTDHWVDLGSGGGLPGLVVAIMARGEGRTCRFTLIESDQRKATFLRTAARELDLPHVTVLNHRIEDALPQFGGVVSARALAPLSALLPMVARHLAADGTAILAKGKSAAAEIADARQNWRFEIEAFPSTTDENASLLRLRRIERAEP